MTALTTDRHMLGVLLAAGLSERNGSTNKLLAPLLGKPMISHVAEAMTASQLNSLMIILGHDADHVAASCGGALFQQIINPHYHNGIGRSIASAMANRRDEVTDVMIILGDMPLITAAIIDELIASHLGAITPDKTITVPMAGGRQGHPVIWGSHFFPALSELNGDHGGKALIKAHSGAINTLHMETPAVFKDADTQGALTEIEDLMIKQRLFPL